MMDNTTRFNRLDYIYKLLTVTALSIAGIILAKDIVIPMAFAAILAIVMYPPVAKLEKWKFKPALAISIVLLITMIVLVLLSWLVVNQLVSLTNDLPNLQTQFEAFVINASSYLRDQFNISTTDQNKMLADVMKTLSGYVGNLLISTSNAVTTFVQIPIYIFLFLIYRDKFKTFFVSLLPENQEMTWRKEIEGVIQGYISGLTLVTLIVASLNTIGLLIVGIDHAIFFGVLSGILTIIPYVGITIGALFPVIMALITKDSLWYAIGVIIVFSIVQFLEGNFISPRITGSKISINAFAAIVALLIGGKILGIAGMILAVPAIGIVKVLLPHTKHLKPFVHLLEDKDLQDEQSKPSEVTEEPKEES